MNKIEKLKEILPLLHHVGEDLITAYPGEPNAFVQIAGLKIKYIFINKHVSQIAEINDNGDVLTLLFDK